MALDNAASEDYPDKAYDTLKRISLTLLKVFKASEKIYTLFEKIEEPTDRLRNHNLMIQILDGNLKRHHVYFSHAFQFLVPPPQGKSCRGAEQFHGIHG